MKKVILILLLLTVVFSAGCVQTDADKEYPNYDEYERVPPEGVEPGTAFLAIAYSTEYGDFETPRYDLASWYSMHHEIKDIIYQWAEETKTGISEPEVVENCIEIYLHGKVIDGNPPKIQARGRYDLSDEEKAGLDELYRRIDEAASKAQMEDIPVLFMYGAI